MTKQLTEQSQTGTLITEAETKAQRIKRNSLIERVQASLKAHYYCREQGADTSTNDKEHKCQSK